MKQIQDEYQSFMEGVRGRAQGAIDQANALFQAYRGDATSSLDAAIHYLQSRFFSFSVGISLSVMPHILHRRFVGTPDFDTDLNSVQKCPPRAQGPFKLSVHELLAEDSSSCHPARAYL